MTTASTSLSIGMVLAGRYRLVAALGKGGMGTVFEAVQEGLGRRVAVKVLDEFLALDATHLERFKREAELVAGLGHPNVVQVTDFQYADGVPFLVMELLRGDSLGKVLDQEGVLTATRIAFIASQALSALDAAHRAGVVHRDVKPDNIFILSEAAVPDTVKILDFGIAKLADGQSSKLTGTGGMLGTPAFMAPEQARGVDDVDARADVYAIGATMYQALTGRLPYEAPSIPALLFAIVEKEPTPIRELRPDLPADLVAVVVRAMAKDRNARYASAEEMRADLAPWSGLAAAGPVSATAATVIFSSAPPMPPASMQPTPIVVSRTPPPHVAKPEPAPPKRGLAALAIVMTAVVAIVGIVMLGVVMLSSRSSNPTATVSSTAYASVSASTITIAIGAPSPSPSPTPSPHPTLTPSPSPSPSPSLALAPTPTPPPIAATGKHYGGTRGSVAGSAFSDCVNCDYQKFRASFRDEDISACYKRAEFEPPLHQYPQYDLRLGSTGITIVQALGGSPTLDTCLVDLVRHTPIQPKEGTTPPSGTFRISFIGECVRGDSNGCK